MKISKIASLEANVPASLSGVTAIAPAADMTFSLWRKTMNSGQSVSMPGDAFQVSGTPITSASTERDMYAATQMVQAVATAGHIYGTDATRKPDGIKIVSPGKKYMVGDKFHLICNGWAATTSPHDAVVTVVEVTPDGGIKDFTVAEQAGTHTYTLGLATADVKTKGGIATVTIGTATGSFAVGDLLNVVGATSGTGAVLQVLTVDGSADLATVAVIAKGSNYIAEASNTVTFKGTVTSPNSGVGGHAIPELASARITIATIEDNDASGKTYNKAVFEITQLGSDADPAVFKTTAAVITAIDVHADDITASETYKVWVAGGSLENKVAPVGAWVEYEVGGTTGAITDGHISTVTGTYTAGQVLVIEEGGVDLGGRYTISTIDTNNDIATGYVSARGAGYTVADNKVLATEAGVDQAARFDVTKIDDFVVSSGVVTFHIPTIAATLASVTGVKKKPQAGDWLKCVAYLSGQMVFTNTATQVGATPTVHVNSTSTGAKIIQVANPVAGALKTVTLGNAGGDAYEVGDILTLVQEGASGGKVIVLSLSTAAVATVAVIQGGQGYTAAANLVTVNEMAGSNDAATVTVSAVATAGEYVTRLVTITYALSGTGNLICTFVAGAKIPAGQLVRMGHTFALGNKVDIDIPIDPNAYVPEVYKVQVGGVTKTLNTDYTLRGGLRLGSHGTCTTATATAAAGDVVEVTQAGASGGQITILTVDGSADVATFEVTAAGTGYFAASGLAVTKVSGDGSVHSAIRFTLAVADIDPDYIFFMAEKSPAALAAVHGFVQTGAMVCVQGDAVEFGVGNGGYHYSFILPTANVIAAVSYE